MDNPFSLKGKTILITGASSGIGKAVAIECSRMGAILVITGRDEERLNLTFHSMSGVGHISVVADLTIDSDRIKLLNQSPKLDGLVHCAGIADPTPFQYVTENKINNTMSINFMSPVVLSNQLYNKKLLNRGASIVFISSVSGVYCSSVAGSMYSASKGAINGCIKGMALDLAGKQIRVNAICPGMIDTNIFEDGRITADQLEEDRRKYPLKRYGKPEEVAYAVIYLLSDASQWVTGSSLLIDGGYTLL